MKVCLCSPIAGSKALQTGFVLPRMDVAVSSDILHGSSLAEFPQVAMLELSLVLPFVLVIRKYALSTIRAKAATTPETKPTVFAVFLPGS